MPSITLRHDSARFTIRFASYCNESSIPRAAGFYWDRDRSEWYCITLRAISRLVEVCVERSVELDVTAEAAAAIEAGKAAEEQRLVEKAMRDAKAAEFVVMSAATDSDLDIPVPAGLSYLPYQKAGIAYAIEKDGVLIGDEPGLGKTIQAVGIANVNPTVRRVLIVVPAALRINWMREWQKWDVKCLSVGIVEGKKLPETDVVIVNYEIVGKHREAIDAVAWDMLVCDEAHYLKNGKAARTKAILGDAKAGKPAIAARRRVFLTGTPILNRPVELYTILQALDPEGLGKSFVTYTRRYCEGYATRFGWDASGASNLDELQTKLRATCMVRRRKADVLKDLPAKRRQLLPFEPNAAVAAILAEMEERHAANEKRVAELRKRAKASAGDADAYAAISAEIRQAKQVAFTEMSDHRHRLAVAKAPIVVEHVKEALESEECLIVMAHHLDVVDAIAEGLAEFGVAVVDGRMTNEQQQAAVDRFQAGEARVFVGSIGAASVGWTLTRASTVVFAELEWVPGIVTQAEDRAHRVGQKASVLIQHLIVDGSLDARFVQVLVEKQAVIDAAMDDGSVEERAEGLRTAAAAPSVNRYADLSLAATTTEEAADAALENAFAEIERLKAEREAANEERKAEYARLIAEREAAAQAALERQHAATMALLEDATDDQIEAAYEAIRIVAADDGDHAQDDNDVGFSKAYTGHGHRLANLSSGARTRLDDAFALKIARIFRRQVPASLRARFETGA